MSIIFLFSSLFVSYKLCVYRFTIWQRSTYLSCCVPTPQEVGSSITLFYPLTFLCIKTRHFSFLLSKSIDPTAISCRSKVHLQCQGQLVPVQRALGCRLCKYYNSYCCN